jgi:hypothetical protein
MAENGPTLEELSETIWNEVCHNVGVVLEECKWYGLAGILIAPDPTLESRIGALKRFDKVCTVIVTALEEQNGKHYSTIKTMLNAKQQMVNLELLLNAAKNADEEGFKEAQLKLDGQAKH